MKRSSLLMATSLLGVMLFMIHLADDIVRGFERGGLYNLTALPIAVFWLYGAVVLTGRRSGYGEPKHQR